MTLAVENGDLLAPILKCSDDFSRHGFGLVVGRHAAGLMERDLLGLDAFAGIPGFSHEDQYGGMAVSMATETFHRNIYWIICRIQCSIN